MIFIGVVIVLLSVLGVFLLTLLKTSLTASNKTRLALLAQKKDQRAARHAVVIFRDFEDVTAIFKSISIFLTMFPPVVIGLTVFNSINNRLNLNNHLESMIATMLVLASLMILIFPYVYITQNLPAKLAKRSPEYFTLLILNALSPVIPALIRLSKVIKKKKDHVFETDIDKKATEASAIEELRLLIKQKEKSGALDKQESIIMERVIGFGDKKARQLMTPKHQLIWLDLNADTEKIRENVHQATFSHYPVGRGSLDNLVGTVHVKDLLCKATCENIDLLGIIKQPLFIPESTSALQIIEIFRTKDCHVAYIIDEYGSLQGLLTLSDLFRAIIGDWSTMSSKALLPKAFCHADGICYIDGVTPIDDFKTLIGAETLPFQEKAGFQTAAGFVQSFLGRIAVTGDSFQWNDLLIEVSSMDGNRIEKLLINKNYCDSGIKATTEANAVLESV